MWKLNKKKNYEKKDMLITEFETVFDNVVQLMDMHTKNAIEMKS